ncbi:MAG: acyltransferase [Lachnospiraceae bacterium]|nr:acyltransferase [Lachnospiraceae bacterium]
MSTESKRNANIELLRILSMIMITFLHALGKADLLQSLTTYPSVNVWLAWFLEALSISAVNIFMLISGYFLIDSQFKISRVLELVFETVFYMVLSLVFAIAVGIMPLSELNTYTLINTFLPIHMEVYWFITCYLVIYILQPLISAGVKNMSVKAFRITIISLVIYECLFKSFLPFKLTVDEAGYSVTWFLTMFLLGAYMKRYSFRFLNTAAGGVALYLAGSILVFTETLIIDFVINRYGRFEYIRGIATTYNHIFPLLASVGIFTAFIYKKTMSPKPGNLICRLSPMALGVYLLQESLPLRYEWQKWFSLPGSLNDQVWLFILKLLSAVLAMYALGTVVDWIRQLLFKLVVRLIPSKKAAKE